jgi:hypothetical protein
MVVHLRLEEATRCMTREVRSEKPHNGRAEDVFRQYLDQY